MMIQGDTVVIAHYIEVMLHIRKNTPADLDRTQVFRRRFPFDTVTPQTRTEDAHIKYSIMGNKDTLAHDRLYLLPKLCEIRSALDFLSIYARELRIEIIEVCFGIFVAGTLILTTAGLLAIEKLRAGDKVLAADPESFEVGEKTILEAFERKVYKLVHLTINGEKIVTTDNHPFYVQGRGFIKAEGLFVGDKLISVDGKDLIVETHDIEQCEKPITVYNFKVEDYHTYFVGNCKIWVHNNDCVKKVESGEIELETKKQKGNYGEMKMDEHYDSKGFEKMHNGVESLDDKIHHGIDGVYKNKDPNGDPKFIIAEAKYGSSQLGNTKKSGPQMGDKWIKNNIGKIVDDPDDIIEGLATGDTVKELFRVNVSNDNGLVNVTTSVKSLK